MVKPCLYFTTYIVKLFPSNVTFVIYGLSYSWQGNLVAVKRLQKAKVALERKVLLELKEVKQQIEVFTSLILTPFLASTLSFYFENKKPLLKLSVRWMYQMYLNNRRLSKWG